MRTWTGFKLSRTWMLMGFCEHGNEISRYVTWRQFLDQRNDYNLVKRDCSNCSMAVPKLLPSLLGFNLSQSPVTLTTIVIRFSYSTRELLEHCSEMARNNFIFTHLNSIVYSLHIISHMSSFDVLYPACLDLKPVNSHPTLYNLCS